MALLSVVLPSYNEEAMIPVTAQTLRQVLSGAGIQYELVFVDDGSRDKTWKEIKTAHEEDPQVHGVRFSRNFGKESAIFAGLANAAGDCVAVMDCDLQHPPETLVEMYHQWEKGFEVVEGVKRSRGRESGAHRKSAGMFYSIMSKAVNADMSRASDFKLLDRKAVDVILEMPEKQAFFRAQSAWIGFQSAQVEFDVQERKAGHSKWNTRSLTKYAFSNIADYSDMPLQMITGAGLTLFVITLIMASVLIVRLIIGCPATAVMGLVLIEMFIGAVLMIALGIIGYYLARIYREVQARPRYIIATKI